VRPPVARPAPARRVGLRTLGRGRRRVVRVAAFDGRKRAGYEHRRNSIGGGRTCNVVALSALRAQVTYNIGFALGLAAVSGAD
ncbi:hypothetical protein KDW39_22805, partial [Burkholderia multivorans]